MFKLEVRSIKMFCTKESVKPAGGKQRLNMFMANFRHLLLQVKEWPNQFVKQFYLR
jgi:hypothetical protein